MQPILTPPWREELKEDQRAVLDPGPHGVLRRPDVLVVGGGAVGVASAICCLQRGVERVLVVERVSLASGASGGAAGLLTPDAHHGVDPEPFVALARAGLGHWRRLHAEIPGGVGLIDIDWISLEPHPPGFTTDTLDGADQLSAEAVASLMPALTSPVPAVRLRQARVNPVRAIAQLVSSAVPTLAVATGVTAQTVAVRGGRVTSVGTTAGPIAPGVVVFATGQSPKLDGLDLDLPSGMVKGHLVLTEPAHLSWPGSVAPLATDIGRGQLLIGGSLDVGDDSPDVRPEMVSGLRAWLEAFVSPASVPPVSRAWCCFRPTHPDLLPVIDRVPGLENAWIASGHYRTGIVMAPATGSALADWIVTGRRPPGLQPFSAARLLRDPP